MSSGHHDAGTEACQAKQSVLDRRVLVRWDACWTNAHRLFGSSVQERCTLEQSVPTDVCVGSCSGSNAKQRRACRTCAMCCTSRLPPDACCESLWSALCVHVVHVLVCAKVRRCAACSVLWGAPTASKSILHFAFDHIATHKNTL